ncbi:ATP-binding protein [Pseudoalteromonas sp. S16_S37]|uniref:ATP-binding protein n=1 Tax=Pseudoalteromonas sp. S16_S37 TaxID=2720228 RepID=UPI0016813070|nr:ATP-binding protein [Pseudoalteromonas sp. S16_S37]MBD1583132.1 ATP-binding protein [Pseudoalteromonas sp. S16_S37]
MPSHAFSLDSEQSALERETAHRLYVFASALKSQDEQIGDAFASLHQVLDKLIATPRFVHIMRLFSLSSMQMRMLALVYLQAQDPDVIAPFLGLSWFEQGPTLSLDKLLTLVDTTLNKQQAMLDINQSSAVFEWGLFRLQNELPSLQQCVYLAPFLQSFLCLGAHDSKQLNYFSLGQSQVDPVFTQCGYTQCDFLQSDLVQLQGGDEQLNHWFVAQSAVQLGAKAAYFIGEQGEHLHFADVVSELASLQLLVNGEPVLLYWPNLTALPKAFQRKLAALVNTMSTLTLVTQSEEALLSDTFGNIRSEHIREPSLQQRAQAWLTLYAADVSSEQDKIYANQLAAKYPVALANMQRLADKAWQLSESDYWQTLQGLCFEAQSQHCDELAKLCQARYTLKDMMLQDKVALQLRELVARVNMQTTLQARLPRFNQGCKALFWGKPGTGKSMAAEAIAGQLQLPLYIVNLANIASKWIGETEKHLAKLFDSAERNNAVLMFDEADAIFAKRSEVESSHDKNANMGVSYLLQRMEHYSGLLLLSTNFKNNLDEAFLRRFHGVIEFTLPTEHERVAVWRRHLEGNADSHLQQGINKLAELFELSAAQIINICEVALLQSLMANKPLISRNEVAIAIHREMAKQHGGFMAQQSLTSWLHGDKHGSNAYL